MSYRVKYQEERRTRRRYKLSNHGQTLRVEDHVRVRKVPVVTIHGDTYTMAEIRDARKRARKCRCGECDNCWLAQEAKRAGV